jgi:aryl-alcohol dehydrogenase-like predicted oxidoreductase
VDHQGPPDQLRGQVEENLRQLGRDYLEAVNLRANGPRTASIAEHFGAPTELREADPIRYLGLSAVLPEHVTEAQMIAPVVCVQNSYGLDLPRADESGWWTYPQPVPQQFRVRGRGTGRVPRLPPPDGEVGAGG